MSETIDIGPVPYDEDCQQVGMPNYNPTKARLECAVFARMLARISAPPMNGSLRVKSFPHDYGNYLSVVAVYDNNCPESCTWAFDLESKGPANWDSIALEELAGTRLDEIKWASGLDLDTLQRMVLDFEDVTCVDGCVVEPDGKCPHGYRSPLLILGVI